MRGNTGDSYAIGIRAGAALVDMEQIQFLPFCLASPPSYEGLLAGYFIGYVDPILIELVLNIFFQTLLLKLAELKRPLILSTEQIFG